MSFVFILFYLFYFRRTQNIPKRVAYNRSIGIMACMRDNSDNDPQTLTHIALSILLFVEISLFKEGKQPA